ncbi:unnamed protein product [Brassica oleracea]
MKKRKGENTWHHTPAPEALPLLLSLRFPFASPVFSSLSLPCRRSASGGPSWGAPGSAWYARWLESRRREGLVSSGEVGF